MGRLQIYPVTSALLSLLLCSSPLQATATLSTDNCGVEENWRPHHVLFQEYTIESQNIRTLDNSVHGSRKRGAAASLRRGSYAQQVALDRHPVTASQRQRKSRLNKMKLATWNIRTGYQSRKLANVEKINGTSQD